MIRKKLLEKISEKYFDIIVIGGGATGLGCAVEAVTRGYKTLLVEASDYSKSTSSRSTKLFHGGVRYLSNGNIGLVKDALRERYLAIQNAPHLCKEINFIIPCYNFLSIPYYYAGLKVYDMLAGFLNLTPSTILSKSSVISKLPNINSANLKGGVQYSDGSFDDSRMSITLLKTFLSYGGIASNYLKVTKFIKQNGKNTGVELLDCVTQSNIIAKSSCIINATGIFSDELRYLDDENSDKVIEWAQGTHIVVDQENFRGKYSLLIPKTQDDRVLFCIPWNNKIIIGTTDIKVFKAEYEPRPLIYEIKFLLDSINNYIIPNITTNNISSIYVGIRPLVRDNNINTSKIARDDKKFISPSGLVTIVGGKWTTYRKMGETTIDFAIKNNLLQKTRSITKNLKLYGYLTKEKSETIPLSFRFYGKDYYKLKSMPNFNNIISHKLNINEAQVEFAVKEEQAITIEDFLARRTRALFLDSKEAIRIAPKVSEIMAKVMGKSMTWQEKQLLYFNEVAKNYVIDNYEL